MQLLVTTEYLSGAGIGFVPLERFALSIAFSRGLAGVMRCRGRPLAV